MKYVRITAHRPRNISRDGVQWNEPYDCLLNTYGVVVDDTNNDFIISCGDGHYRWFRREWVTFVEHNPYVALQRGQVVRVTDKPPDMLIGRYYTWTISHENYCGQYGTVYTNDNSASSLLLTFDNGRSYWFHYLWLQLRSTIDLYAVVLGPSTNPNSIPEVFKCKERGESRAKELGGTLVEFNTLLNTRA